MAVAPVARPEDPFIKQFIVSSTENTLSSVNPENIKATIEYINKIKVAFYRNVLPGNIIPLLSSRISIMFFSLGLLERRSKTCS